jgi:hypothetical protein
MKNVNENKHTSTKWKTGFLKSDNTKAKKGTTKREEKEVKMKASESKGSVATFLLNYTLRVSPLSKQLSFRTFSLCVISVVVSLFAIPHCSLALVKRQKEQ